MRGGPPKQGDRHSGSGEPRGKQGTQRTRADDEGFHETTTALRRERVPADRNRLLTGHHDPSRQSWQAGRAVSCEEGQIDRDVPRVVTVGNAADAKISPCLRFAAKM